MINSYTVIKKFNITGKNWYIKYKTNIKGMLLQFNVMFDSIASCTESLLFVKAQNQIKTVSKCYITEQVHVHCMFLVCV